MRSSSVVVWIRWPMRWMFRPRNTVTSKGVGKSEPVEAEKRCGSRPTRPHVAADVEQEGSEFAQRRDIRAGESEGLTTDCLEGAALDSAPKLVI